MADVLLAMADDARCRAYHSMCRGHEAVEIAVIRRSPASQMAAMLPTMPPVTARQLPADVEQLQELVGNFTSPKS